MGIETTIKIDEIDIEIIARVCHQVNLAYCKGANLGYQPSWELAPPWQRDSAIQGVIYHLNNPEATPEDSHKEWCNSKLNEGWVYGEKKNPELKTHPCLVQYRDLPVEQRVKDYLFSEVVKTLSNIWREI